MEDRLMALTSGLPDISSTQGKVRHFNVYLNVYSCVLQLFYLENQLVESHNRDVFNQIWF